MDRLFSLLRRWVVQVVVEALADELESRLRPQTPRIVSIHTTPVEGNPMAVKATIVGTPVLEADGVVSRELTYTILSVATVAAFTPADVISIVVPAGASVDLALVDIDQAGNRSGVNPFTFVADVTVPDITPPTTPSILSVTLETVPE